MVEMMPRPVTSTLLMALLAMGWAAGTPAQDAIAPAPAFYPDQPDCRVKSVQKLPTTFESPAKSPTSDAVAVSEPAADGVYQIYMVRGGARSCISCTPRAGGPRVDRNKMMVSWHPSGQWLVVGVEENTHGNSWMPKSWQRGLLQSGIWLNIWVTTPTGERWYQITDFKKSATNPSDGFTGTAFTPDGSKAAWAEIVDGNVFRNHFGIWKLYAAEFRVSPDGDPHFANKKDITPAGARWVEPGNFSPDGRHLLISSDIGLRDAQGQDQFALDVVTGQLQNLTQSPLVWDEHGLYSPNGRKISFMSSYPYRGKRDSYKASSLRTEFMLMDADGSQLQQLTHFNVPGYPESQPKRTVAAVAAFIGDGSQLFATVMATDYSFTKTNWTITFEGPCGGQSRPLK